MHLNCPSPSVSQGISCERMQCTTQPSLPWSAVCQLILEVWSQEEHLVHLAIPASCLWPSGAEPWQLTWWAGL